VTEPVTAETPRHPDDVGDSGEVLTVRDVAQYLKLPISTIYALAQRGQLPGRKLGRQWRFFKPGLEAWLLAQENQPV
jgi:excisionase family DNA binding protein